MSLRTTELRREVTRQMINGAIFQGLLPKMPLNVTILEQVIAALLRSKATYYWSCFEQGGASKLNAFVAP